MVAVGMVAIIAIMRRGQEMINDFYYCDPNTGEYKKLESLESVELTLDTDCMTDKESMFLNPSNSMTWTLNVGLKNARAIWIWLNTGNDLYIRFPKKLRRKRGR
jgi:hypothetical protein